MKLIPLVIERHQPVGWKTAFFGLFLVALIPRLLGVGRYITPDELVWVFRSIQFREAILSHQWPLTLTAGHPGVITTWLGSLGISLQLLLRPESRNIYEWLTQVAWLTSDNMMAFTQLAKLLTSARLSVAIVNSLGIVFLFGLTRSLFGSSVAWLSALLLALDPFLAGLSGLLHVDGLLTTFATISLLALGIGVRSGQQNRYLALSGASAAMAVLAKSPALLLVPLSGLLIVYSAWQDKEAVKSTRLKALVVRGSVWLAAFLLLLFMLFPAMWSSLRQVVQLISADAGRHLGGALRVTFFLGRAGYVHDYRFYPIVLAFRLGPLVVVGLLLAGLHSLRSLHQRVARLSPATLALALWSLLYIVGISLAAKKFDRYALPVIPPLSIIAALAWSKLVSGKRDRPSWTLSVLLAFQCAYLVTVVPYPLSAFDPLLGGSRIAEKALTIGWGEAISAAGKWLSELPEAANKVAMAGSMPSLAPFFSGKSVPFSPDNLAWTDYIILSANDRQLDPIGAQQITAGAELIHSIRYGGLDQAWIYARADAVESSSPLLALAEALSFDNRVALLGTGSAPSVDGERLYFYGRWRLLHQRSGNFTVQLTLRDEDNQVWSRLEAALLNESYFRPEHWDPGETPEIRYVLELPPAIPPSTYLVELTLFDQDGDRQLSVLTADGDFRGVVYRQEVELLPALRPWESDGLGVPMVRDVAWQDGLLRLIGSSTIPAELMAGSKLPLELFWQARGSLPAHLRLEFLLGGSRLATVPLSRFDSGRWRPGEVVHEKYRLLVPPERGDGQAAIQVRLVSGDNAPITGPVADLGILYIEATDRLFSLPSDIPVLLDYVFAGSITLAGLDPETLPLHPGETLSFTLYWQAEREQEGLIYAFAHLLGPGGEIVAQADHWPGGQPSDTWLAGQVIVDQYQINLPADAPIGQYQVAVGLYRSSDGLRLTVTDSDDSALLDDHVFLPIRLGLAAPGS